MQHNLPKLVLFPLITFELGRTNLPKNLPKTYRSLCNKGIPHSVSRTRQVPPRYRHLPAGGDRGWGQLIAHLVPPTPHKKNKPSRLTTRGERDLVYLPTRYKGYRIKKKNRRATRLAGSLYVWEMIAVRIVLLIRLRYLPDGRAG